MLGQIITLVGNIAPTIATALGSPIAGTALRLLGNALGVPASADRVMTALQQNPDVHDILSGLEQQHSCWLAPIVTAGRPQSVEVSLKIAWPAA